MLLWEPTCRSSLTPRTFTWYAIYFTSRLYFIELIVGQYPYGMPPYFPMPFGGFGENTEEAIRMGRQYYDHQPGAYSVAADNSSSPSSVSQQNSQSPPPQNPSQYPMPSYQYYPPYMHHPYYQTSSAQFQQFPGYGVYKPYH